MKILATSNNCITDKLGYYMALVNYPGSRKCYWAALRLSDNAVIDIKKTYPSRKVAFAELNPR